tara:strand:+ start:1267 stop:1440 length:174 start_codon:yes stop_codon:yes gene_type:complete
MIVCICNAVREKDIEKVCKECRDKEEFCLRIKRIYGVKSCFSCYEELLNRYEKESEE